MSDFRDVPDLRTLRAIKDLKDTMRMVENGRASIIKRLDEHAKRLEKIERRLYEVIR